MTLSSSWTFPNGRVLAGRTALAPLTNLQSDPDGKTNANEIHWLSLRAAGGFSVVNTAAAFVSEQGKAWLGQIGVANASHEAPLAKMAAAIHEAGPDTLAIVQLHHGGKQATYAPEGERISASADEDSGSREATKADIQHVIEDYVAAARRSEAAGFDGVELHGANGYLFTQFLSPIENNRTDEYGGSTDNRARFLVETLRAVKAAVSPEFLVGVRLSPLDAFASRGLTVADSVHVAKLLADAGAHFIHLSMWSADTIDPVNPDVPVAAAFRKALPADVAVMAAGGIWTKAQAEHAQASGADIVVVGRAGIAHADWPARVVEEGFQPVHPTWSPDYLASQGLSEAFVNYLMKFPGMVEGGAPPRA